jgi:DNA-binding response OmpR family regulator
MFMEELARYGAAGPGRGARRLDVEPCRVLLAEDDAALRQLLCSALRRDGYEVVPVADGTELLSVIGDELLRGDQGWDYDLVISDERMPGWSGLQMLAGLRETPERPPVVLITAFGDHAFHDRARALGAAATMDKPFDIDDLRTLICNLLSHVAPSETGRR